MTYTQITASFRRAFRRKYTVTALVNFAASFLSLCAVVYVYGYIGYGDASAVMPILHPTVIVALAVSGYMIGYVHECIPHCTGSLFRSMIRFVGMMTLLIAPLMFMLLRPEGVLEVLFALDVIGSVVIVPAAITVWLMYRFARERPGDAPSAVCPLT